MNKATRDTYISKFFCGCVFQLLQGNTEEWSDVTYLLTLSLAVNQSSEHHFTVSPTVAYHCLHLAFPFILSLAILTYGPLSLIVIFICISLARCLESYVFIG